MSNIQLREEIESIINNSGYSKSKELICPIMRIISMRHKDVPVKQIYEITKSII